jgi:endonuclease/exonuclease/phosphatase family metal-dependent hydrolase
MTANIGGTEWMGWNEREALATDVFGSVPADIVGFQEFGKDVDTLTPLQQKRPEFDFYLGEIARDSFDKEIYVNPIAYDRRLFTQEAADTFWLSEDGSQKPSWDDLVVRAASWVLLSHLETSTKLLFVNTHLDNIGRVARNIGARLVLQFIESFVRERFEESLPVVLTADSNMSTSDPFGRWNDPERRSWEDADMRAPYSLFMEAGFKDAWVEAHPAAPGEKPKRPGTFHDFKGPGYAGDGWGTYDTEWILVRNLGVTDASLVLDSRDGRYPSDHYWMTAELQLPAPIDTAIRP